MCTHAFAYSICRTICSNTGICDKQSTVMVDEVEYDCCAGFAARTDNDMDDQEHDDDDDDNSNRDDDNSNRDDDSDAEEHERSDSSRSTTYTSNERSDRSSSSSNMPGPDREETGAQTTSISGLLLEGCPISKECLKWSQLT